MANESVTVTQTPNNVTVEKSSNTVTVEGSGTSNSSSSVTQSSNTVSITESPNTVSVSGGASGSGLSSGGTISGSLGITQNLDVDGVLETDALTIDGVSLTETIQDVVGGMVSGNTENGISVTYDDSDGTLDFSTSSITDQNFTNADHDKLDGIEAGATADQTAAEIKILVESATDSNVFTDADHTKLNGIAEGAEVNVQSDWNATSGDALILNKPTIPSGSQIIDWTVDQFSTDIHVNNLPDIPYSAITGTPPAAQVIDWTTDQGYVDIHLGNIPTIPYSSLSGRPNIPSGNQILDWTTDQGATNIHVGNIPTIAYSSLSGTPTIPSGNQILDWTTDQGATNIHVGNIPTIAYSSLSGTPTIPSGNQVIDWTTDQGSTNIHAGNYINTEYSVGDGGLTQNNFTDADHLKLNNIEAGATADQTAAEIRALVESATDSNVFTDADHTKLNGIAAGAEVNVQSDWNATSGDSFIQNKPTIPSGSQIIDWTLDQGSTVIHAGNYTDTNTTYTAGSGITLSGTTFSHADTSAQSSVSNSAGSVIQSINLDGLGHITQLTTANLDSRYYTETETNQFLALKAPLSGPTFTGVPSAPTAGSTTNTTQIATTAFVQTRVGEIIDSAPAALDTLNELAAALGDDANFSTTVTNSIATKLPLAGGQMTGNITMSGSETVDGRDLSVDGAKLDDIEAGATADQTASEILTLIKTVDGSGSGLDADTLDGISSASFLRSDADDTMSGNLTIAKTDPTITLFDNSGANTDPNGTIIFSEASGTTNFDINYNGSDE